MSESKQSQAVKDALADAETLRINTPLLGRVRIADVAAADHDEVPYYSAAGNRSCAICSARAAFVAVPGLRG